MRYSYSNSLISLLGLCILLYKHSFVCAYYDDDGGDDGGGLDDDLYKCNDDDCVDDWSVYSILPRKCITYNNEDVIVFSVFDEGYMKCSDSPEGTFTNTVPEFVGAYYDQMEYNAADMGDDAYAGPEQDYLQCTAYETNAGVYYVRLGCTDNDSQSLSVNIYKDNTCTELDTINGFDDAENIDVSDLQLPFKKCQPCVTWVDKDDDVDDQYFEKKTKYAPLCSQTWTNKQECNKKCQKMGKEQRENGWNTSDKVLLVVLSLFGAGMLVVILKKRSKMSNKETLLEQAAMSAAGLERTHVIGIFLLVVLVIFVFALLGLKAITWTLLLIMNTVLFGYLMKLTVDSGVRNENIGPDGKIVSNDEYESGDDSVEEEDENENGQYTSPVIPTSPLPQLS